MSIDSQTIERTRTEVSVDVEEVTETLYACENCGQAYDAEDVQTVGLDLDADGDPVEERLLCDGCSEAIFGYEELEGREYLSRSLQEFDGDDVADMIGALSASVVSVGVGIGSAILPIAMVAVAIRGISGVLSALSSPDAQTAIQQSAENMDSVGGTVLELLPLFVLFLLVVALIGAASAIGPRRV